MHSYSKNQKLYRSLGFVFVIALCVSLLVITPSAAQTADTTITDLTVAPTYRNLTDGNYNTSAGTNTLTLSSQSDIDSVYIIFWSEMPKYTLNCGDKSFEGQIEFLHALIKVPEEVTECKQLTLTFDKQVSVSDVYAFTEGELPGFVQTWKSPYDRADILLNSSHADDEQLFFAGVLPYHVAMGYRVQIVYFTDHTNTLGRRHELLNGLWQVGIDHYPVISSFPDAYSTTKAWALTNLKNAGYTDDDAIAFQTEMLRRFKPQVVVGHDINGEYGHGQHMLNIDTLIKAIDLASNAENYPASAEKYGVWDTPKLYIHNYKENPVVLNWDEPLDYFGGKTAFQMTQEGYKHHHSQQYTWFTDWLNGNNNSITKASQINTYSPCEYGLYRSTVGEDVEKNSFFENIISYDEQERIEQERLEQERLQQEEESRRLEEESIRAEEESKRLESEAEASRKAESERIEREKQEALDAQKKSGNNLKAVVAVVILVAAVATLGVIVFQRLKSLH